MNFREATAKYENWLAQEIKIVPADRARKHDLMRAALFPFFRATFYRWIQIWPEFCPDLAKAQGACGWRSAH